jgi:quercetin dioxygenase-like cupin family protein
MELDVAHSSTPIALSPGEGEIMVDAPSRSSRIKAARDEILLFESSSGPRERGAKPHTHREHADAFYMLEGELIFHVAGEQRSLRAGAFVLAPPGLVHGFDVGGDGARYLNIHTPGGRYVSLARARRDGIDFDSADGDTFPVPEDGGRPTAEAVVLDAGEGEHLGTTTIKVGRPEISVLEFELRTGGGVDPHFHKGHSDSFYVLEGEVEFHVGDEVVTGTVGSYVLAPPNIVHHFRNVSDHRARIFNLHTPGGFAEYRRELEELKAKGIEPDASFFESHDIFDV